MDVDGFEEEGAPLKGLVLDVRAAWYAFGFADNRDVVLDVKSFSIGDLLFGRLLPKLVVLSIPCFGNPLCA